jgi:hypothetical protein
MTNLDPSKHPVERSGGAVIKRLGLFITAAVTLLLPITPGTAQAACPTVLNVRTRGLSADPRDYRLDRFSPISALPVAYRRKG